MANLLIKRLAIAGVILAFFVVGVGAYTRLADAGLGCPDWPGCYGFLTVPESVTDVSTAEQRYPDAPVEVVKAWWEMGHRYIAGALLALVFVTFLLAWRFRSEQTPTTLLSALLVIIICQAAFGAWTVTLKLWPQVVTAHLLGGFTTLSLLWLLLLRQGALAGFHRGLPAPGKLAAVALIAVVVQITLGGWVSSNYAALACPMFPSCDGSYAPTINLAEGFNVFQSAGPNYLGGLMDNEARKAIHWVHRTSAIIVALIVATLALRLLAFNRALAVTMLVVLATQIGLGITNVVWALPLINATLHNIFGALLLITVVTVNFAPRLRFVTPESRTTVHRRDAGAVRDSNWLGHNDGGLVAPAE